ncbi:MAG: NAD(P)H-binding protein, partial [Myxococcaceae bacterium]|nr:NAD(P)H-binding protein [Myxococcaceae bacterium]
MRTAFVTGATGLLGSNLVAQLLQRGVEVKALVRDVPRAQRLLPSHPRLKLVVGDMDVVAGFAPELAGCDVLFHCAAYFRDSFKGGEHWQKLRRINVDGTRDVVRAAYAAGVRRLLHVSSVGVLKAEGSAAAPVGPRDRRAAEDTRNDYYRSKILADAVVKQELEAHPDLWAAFVMPGFMNGPGDAGPTSAAQSIIDFTGRKLPGILDAHFSYVDARDVAEVCIAAVERAPRGAELVAGGRRLNLADAFKLLEGITGVPAPKRRVSLALLWLVAVVNEAWARLTGRPVLVGMSIYRMMRDDGPYAFYDSSLTEQMLGVRFRPV